MAKLFHCFEQVDEIFVVTPNEGKVSDKLYGPEGTEKIETTVEAKKNVFGTYFVPGTGNNRLDAFEDIISAGEHKLDSIKNIEFNIQNQSDVDMFIVFNVHYYAKKAGSGDSCLQFALYNTIYGKINDPFNDNSGRVRKGEFLQIGDGNIASVDQLNNLDNNDPFNYFSTLRLDDGTLLACQSSNSTDTELDNYLAIRYGGEDNIEYNNQDYCPHNAFINQYHYGPVSSGQRCFNGTSSNTNGSLVCRLSGGQRYNYLDTRYTYSQTDLKDFIVNSKSSAGFNINIIQGEAANIDDNCFISGITLTAVPCANIWSNYQQSGN